MTLLALPIEVEYQTENDWETPDESVREVTILIDPQQIESICWAGDEETRITMGNQSYFVRLPFDVLRSKLASMGWRIETLDRKEHA